MTHALFWIAASVGLLAVLIAVIAIALSRLVIWLFGLLVSCALGNL